jgi:hypothetical protein
MSRSQGRSLRIYKTEIKELSADDGPRAVVRSTVDDTRTELTDAVAEVRAAPRPTPAGRNRPDAA